MKTSETPVAYRIIDLQENERPRERLEHQGASALSNAELLAILLRVGLPGENVVQVGHRLLNSCGGLVGLHKMSFQALCKQRGVGQAKAAQIKAALEIGKRLAQESIGTKPEIHSPREAADQIIHAMSALEQEELWILLLDTRHHFLRSECVYRGSLNTSMVRIAELFRSAIRENVAAIIIAHNHPSGDPTPSPEDIALTREIVKAGKLLDINVLDHLVIGGPNFVSLKERGLGFSE